ncbi:MAG TPA: NifU family protein [Streptosporangiaceae bacterium]|jgi:Fe-S cluster biogenesis protein NfuA/nitrite reductase/ring-hydroxylating ferredoxin subunit
MSRVQQAGERIEELLARLGSAGGDAGATAEELVRLLVGLYGDGLAHVVETLSGGGEAGAALLAKLTEDPLVESLLLLHGLHPDSVDDRIQQALDQVRPYLGSHAGGVVYLGVSDGVAQLRLEGSCHGCPSSTVTVKLAIEGAVKEAAPELTDVVVEGMTTTREPTLLQIGPRPGAGEPAPPASAGPWADGSAGDSHGAWVSLPEIGPPSARPVTTSAGGMPVLVCAVRGTLYAFRDACASCGAPMGTGVLEREVLTCDCGSSYDVTRAGRGRADPALHLDPLPLLADSQGVRVAVPAQVPS